MSVPPPHHRRQRKQEFDHMEVRKNAVDVSAFFFFEATGDSEADNLNDPDAAAAIDGSHPDDDDNGDDDAESCSCDLSDGFSFVIDRRHHHEVINGCDSRPCCCSTADDDDNDEEEEEEEGEEAHSYSTCSCKNTGAAVEGEKKSSVSAESSGEIMSEKEKNRLFWEACLAS